MSEKKDGGPAYPRTQWTGSDKNLAHRDVPGMTLRDYFAGQALVTRIENYSESWKELAESAYAIADAMLAERDK